MKPPDDVPEGLSAIEYQRLVALYTLMNRHSQATRALAYLTRVRNAARDLEKGVALDPEHADEADTAQAEKEKEEAEGKAGQGGAEFADALLALLRQVSSEDEGDESSILDDEVDDELPPDLRNEETQDDEESGSRSKEEERDPIVSMKEQLMEIGMTQEEAEEALQKLKQALRDMTRPNPPPREVPDALSAQEYWDLALRYKQVGWTEQARDALVMAIEIDGDGSVGKKAQCFLRSKIPRYPVPLMAEQLNIQGYNQMFQNEDEARRTFEKLVSQYPDFEWPYGNLGSLLIKSGDLDGAEDVLKQAVEINPYYINAWLHLSRVYAIESRFPEADDCLERVLAIDPEDPNWPGIRELVDQLKYDRFN